MKIIKLTENDLVKIVKRVLNEAELAKPTPIKLSNNISSDYSGKINFNNISSTGKVEICKADSEGCAQFVNDYSNKIGFVGDAWLAHNNDELGSRIYTAFHNLKPEQIKKVIDLWLKIDKKGGGVKGGEYNNQVSELVNGLVPQTPNVQLKVDDVVGLYYPPSKNHELAFYNAGKPYFIDGETKSERYFAKGEGKDPYNYKYENGKFYYTLKSSYNKQTKKFKWVLATDPKAINSIKTKKFSKINDGGSDKKPGKTISQGTGWGMNTHVGIVGAIKDGVPIIFHNIHGNVFSEPYNKLSDGAMIAWVRRPSQSSK